MGLAVLACLGTLGCSSEDADTDPDADTGPEPGSDCDETRRPVLFVHGGFGAGDNFELQGMRFSSNGYCRSSLRVHDYDSTGVQSMFNFGGDAQQLYDDNIELIDDAVDRLLDDTGFDQIDLVGHSFGTGVSADYLSEPGRAAKIAHYANVAGGQSAALPVPVVNIASDGDKVVGNADVPEAEQPDVGYLDHMAILTAEAPFVEMYKFFNDGEMPEFTQPVSEETVEVSGFFRNFGDNAFRPGVMVSIYPVDAATGERLDADPEATSETGDDGSFGPVTLSAGTHYEFLLPGAGEAGREIHMYRTPFVRSTHLMYLKGMPSSGIASTLLSGLVKYDDDRADAIVQHNHRAMIAGQHVLTVDGEELLTPEVAGEDATLIALFAVDEDADGVADLTPLSRFVLPIPFLGGIDMSIPTDAEGPIEFVFEGETLHTPRWKGDTEGTVVVLFDN